MGRRRLISVMAVIAVATVPLHSQTPSAPLSFEVASVKPLNARPSGPDDIKLGCRGTDSHSPGITIPMGRCISRFESLRMVIALAYDIPPSSMYPYEGVVLSGPDWINSAMYNIEAKAEGAATYAELRQMLQTLLADRFQLKVHRETREMPVYAMVVGKNGLKLSEAPKDRDCGDQARHDHRFELGATSLSGQCHGFVPDNGALTGRSVDMSDFAEMLSIWAGRLVVDKTGIKGLFDIKMPRLAPANAIQVAEKSAAVIREGVPGQILEPRLLPESLPTVFTALEQIGLKLESAKGPLEVLVIDNIQRPSEN